jgi:hypothetical protein
MKLPDELFHPGDAALEDETSIANTKNPKVMGLTD